MHAMTKMFVTYIIINKPSNKKEFSTEELEENLKCVLNGLQVNCQEVETTYVQGNIRKDCVTQSIRRKREAAGNVGSSSCQSYER